MNTFSESRHDTLPDASGHEAPGAAPAALDGLAEAAPPGGGVLLVDCVVRSDAGVKSGGDTVQIREYARYLAPRGVDVREVPFHPTMTFRPGAVVHTFNVDRPIEYLVASRIARSHRRLVSPIHHNIGRVRRMRSAERGRGLTSLVGRVLPEGGREWLGLVVRALRRSTTVRECVVSVWTGVTTLPALPNVWRRVGVELDRSEAVALLAEGEGRDLAALTGWQRRNAVLVPNGRPEDTDLRQRREWSERSEEILVVGRIEPRKRQLELARAADRLQVRVSFIGQRSNAGDAYTRAFDELAASSPFVQYIGSLERTEVMARMGAARVLVNGSWVEVQSLVDLEAASMGCAVVASDAGHSREWLQDAVVTVQGDDVAALLLEAQRIATEPHRAVTATGYTWTWEQASDRLYELYRAGR